MVTPPGKVLDQARVAAKTGDYPRALAAYELFFDRALQDQGVDHNYYGVRLSYCLSEWARLGEKYPAARERLEAKAEEALGAFEATGDFEKFHDFHSIRHHLGQDDAVFSQFVEYHESKPGLATVASRLMWNRLVEAQRWDLCAAYLGDHAAKYDSALYRFDESMTLCRENASFGGDDFANQIKGWYVRDVGNLLRALQNTGRLDAASSLEATVKSDMQSRGFPELVASVDERAGGVPPTA